MLCHKSQPLYLWQLCWQIGLHVQVLNFAAHVLKQGRQQFAAAWFWLQVLLAWSRTKVLVSFRGTASLANALADIQVSPQPPCHVIALIACDMVHPSG